MRLLAQSFGFYASLSVLTGALVSVATAAPQPEPVTAPIVSSETAGAVLDQYCVTCHSTAIIEGRGSPPSILVSQLRDTGLALDAMDPSDVSADAEAWERVVRKLRARAMPPVGRPRPDEITNDALASWLEGALDAAAVASPNPGRRPALHRLSRTEYQNAVRDLLGLQDLPKELDVSVILPADNATSGFDNLAELLFVSPTLMERYLGAARKISRLAVGDPTMLPIVDTFRLDRELVQDSHIEGLPLGTRGGTRIRSHLPLDGEYLVTVEFARGAREPHDVEISVDGQRVRTFTVGETSPERTASGVFTFDADPDVQVRLPLSGRSPRDRRRIPPEERCAARRPGAVHPTRTRPAAGDCQRHGERPPLVRTEQATRQAVAASLSAAHPLVRQLTNSEPVRVRSPRRWRGGPIDGLSPTRTWSGCSRSTNRA